MPRYPRLLIPHLPLHIVQRGHDRKPVFVQEPDYELYLSHLQEVKKELAIRVIGYCLMTNHVHLILVPGDDATTISKLMRILAARQTRHTNRIERRSGTLWEGRFKASLIDTDQYLLTCCRYVDLNPVRATMVVKPREYRWSGYRCRVGLASDRVLDEHHIFEALGRTSKERAIAYKRFVDKDVDESEETFIRLAARRNQITGSSRFKQEIEERVGRRLSSKAPGRPPKQPSK